MPKSTRGDALRNAVDQTFQVAAGQAQTTRGRAQELVDDLAQTAGRLRGALEEIRPLTGEEMRSVRDRLSALERRVVELEMALDAGPRQIPRKTARPAARRAARKATTAKTTRQTPKTARPKPTAARRRARSTPRAKGAK